METVMLDSYLVEYPELDGQLDVVQFSKEETQQIQDPYAWFIYPKTQEGEKLRADVDEALLKLVGDGTLLRLSNEYFGFDATGR
jgi:ABC-type amino acid transport substrate-binding protein